MPRSAKTITFSLPPEMADRVDNVMKQQGRSRSDLLREAVLRYIEDCEWEELLQYGERRARELGIRPEDVDAPGGGVPGGGRFVRAVMVGCRRRYGRTVSLAAMSAATGETLRRWT